jgi:hypothetical protein
VQGEAKVIAMPRRSKQHLEVCGGGCILRGVNDFLGYINFTGKHKIRGEKTADPVMTAAAFTQSLEKPSRRRHHQNTWKENGTQEDIAALTSSIDEADLPDQEEYFYRQTQTLDKFFRRN